MANIGYIQVAHFAVAIERRRHPELGDCPVIIGGHPHERKTVYDASSEAVAMGVQPGQPLRQAQHLCPKGTFLPLADDRYLDAAAAFLAIIECFSPTVEIAAPGSAYFDTSGLQLLFGTNEQFAYRLITSIANRLGLIASVGFGPTRFTALVAARLSKPGDCLIASGTTAEFLSPLSLDHLREAHRHTTDSTKGPAVLARLEESCYERLRLLGIHTIGQFLKLPYAELMEQLGPVGIAAYRLARGDSDELLLPREQPAALQRTRQYEPPLRACDFFTSGIR